MEKYLLDCGSYTEECFGLMLDFVGLCEGVCIKEIDSELQKATIIANKESCLIIKKIVAMGDLGEFYEESENRE